MHNTKVSVLIPCYNMEKKISRMLESLLSQTIRDFKVYVIDDGSKDKSKEIVESYIDIFHKKGIILNYVRQENGGVSAAVNNGLSRVDTEYFCLPDADDYLESTYMEECISFLSSHKDCGVVFTQCNVYHQDNLKKKVGLLQRKDHFQKQNEEIIHDFIWGTNVYYCPDYMIRTSDFMRANGEMKIEAGRYGQNYQILLPITYHTKCGYIEKPLYNYIIYKQSISHGRRTIEQRYNSINGGKVSLHETLKKMRLDEDKERELHHQVDQKIAIQKAEVALEYGEKKLFNENYNKIDVDFVPAGLKKSYQRQNWPLWFSLIKIEKQLRSVISSSSLFFNFKATLIQIMESKVKEKCSETIKKLWIHRKTAL